MLFAPFICALIFATAVIMRSLSNFSRTGPQIQEEIRKSYSAYTVYALGRLYFWCVAFSFFLAMPGSSIVFLYCKSTSLTPSLAAQLLFGFISIGLLTSRQFMHHLFNNPGVIVSSINFDPIRLHALFRNISKAKLDFLDAFLGMLFVTPYAYFIVIVFPDNHLLDNIFLIGLPVIYWLAIISSSLVREPKPLRDSNHTRQPNILMIGSDTLRADHLGSYGYSRNTTPFIDTLASKGAIFKHCYVPLARTAPSLISIFTGCWPNRHKVKTNYTALDVARSLKLNSLGSILCENGYQTSVISDWSGADFGKFNLGFQHLDLPDDQWNLKYLIRQGPKDIRLLLSLFCHNRLGKVILPELYYLAGVPLTKHLGAQARRQVKAFSNSEKPFFINVFMGTTHPPFSSNAPYFSMYADRQYDGKSKFCMSRLTTPEEIIESQREPKEAFDLDQVIALYDGAIRQFDDETAKIVGFLEQSNLIDNTIILLYSDHGIDLFEYDTWGQGNSIASKAGAHIPLIISAPGHTEPVKIDKKVRSIDIMPTLLDLCGIPAPGGIDGVSLLPAMTSGDTLDNLPVIYETGLWLVKPPMQRADHLNYPDLLHLLDIPDKAAGTLAIKSMYARAVEDARDYFIWKGNWMLKCYPLTTGTEQHLFNLNEDPDCSVNIAAEHPDIVTALLALRVC